MPASIDDEKSLSFGPNAWLIDEMFRRFSEDPDSVGESWRDFFTDYKPVNLPAAPSSSAPPQTDIPSIQTAPETKTNGRDEQKLPEGAEPLRGPAALIAKNMEKSLGVPTATSTRIIPVKLLEENRRLINEFMISRGGSKVSFTHIIAWAIMVALKKFPAMSGMFISHHSKPHKLIPEHINFGLAIDVQKKDGSRTLLVPNIKDADTKEFSDFFSAYNDLIRKVRTGSVDPDDFSGTTVSLTNPGTIGTVHSIPRLMQGQGLIVATGSIQYPPEWQSADPQTIARMGISKVMMISSTYDHRIIQGAESGLFLQFIHKLLQGEDQFYESIFSSLKIPFQVVTLARDINPIFGGASGAQSEIEKQGRVLQLINMYRVRGHLIAHTNTLSDEVKSHPELDPDQYNLSIWDYDREFFVGGLGGMQYTSLRKALDILREAYCRTIGVEYMHIQEPDQKKWIQQRLEGIGRAQWLDDQAKKRILFKLNDAEAFERFLHTKYIGHKRFSLEGAESLIPMLDALLTGAGGFGVNDVVIGMAHRGRLNVLANIIGKSYRRIFSEFEGNLDPESSQGTGDVKYHLGAHGTHRSEGGLEVNLTLASNPSHLEAVDPVVEGIARAKQDLVEDKRGHKIMPLLIHGDSAFAGQGVVAETFNLSGLPAYFTGGTVHVVVNNIIGFTTAPHEARTSQYATDVAKMVQAPIFHVNGDDPEACVRAIQVALAFRMEYGKDVVVDMVCYRRHGHNEGDEPSYTQPLMYKKIKEKRSVRKLYTETLVRRGDLTLDQAEEAMNSFHAQLETAFEDTKDTETPEARLPFRDTPPPASIPTPPTSVPEAQIDEINKAMKHLPDAFTGHPKLTKWLETRYKTVTKNKIEWATAEAFAFGSLLIEGTPIRLVGQDSQRGTFSQRHSVFVDYENEAEFTPLNHIREEQAELMIYDSSLSEYAAIGFEYGYSIVRKEALVIWEAQFGDFVNGGQIIIDQFISSAENKWNQKSRLVMLLPHGYEGQGPEHSSARLERFLVLCAESNMIVAFPTTPAQYFHLLRRQMKTEIDKPLIVMTPKSLLRHPAARSKKEQLTGGEFHVILDDTVADPKKIKRLLLCTGKIYYDLDKYREEHKNQNVAIIRFEQLYPFPYSELKALFNKYKNALEIRWVQEEPRNMGAWYFILPRLRGMLKDDSHLELISRYSSGSPASGSSLVHQAEQEEIVKKSFE